MAERAYTVSEIDRMRAALLLLEPKITRHEVIACGPVTHWVQDRTDVAQRDARVEDKLRTYMLGGASPWDLEDRAAVVKAQQEKNERRLAEALRK